MRIVRKSALLALAIWLTGLGALAARPALAATRDAIQNVFITNTADNPVPVSPQGTTQVAGTVTVANPTPAASQPTLVQQGFETQPITRQQPFVGGTLYQVPAGKVLTVEYFQVHWIFSGVHLRQAILRAAGNCSYAPPADANIDRAQVFFPDQAAGDGYHVAGGSVKLLVPAGGCLTYEVGAVYSDIAEGSTLYVYGSFTGTLTDAPAA
jgi:hypothetical protein